jgi:hypothetical protein
MNRPWVRVLVLDGLIVIGWLTSAGMVILHERGQLWGGLGNPTASLGATLEAQNQRFGIYYQGQKIGFSQMTLVPQERNGMPGVAVIDRGRLAFNLLGAPQQLEVTAQAFIDADWRLQEFTAAIHSATYQLKWSGHRHDEEILLTVTTPTTSITKRLKDPVGSAFVNGLSSWSAFHRLHVGQSGKAWVLNPLALSPEVVSFHVRRSEVVGGKEALVIETDVGGLMTTSWVTPEGEVLKETSPLGWELRQESEAQTLQQFSRLSPTLDLLSATSVPIDRPLEDPERVDRLILLIEGVEADDIAIQRPWQSLLPSDRLSDYHRSVPQGPWCLVQLDRPPTPDLRGARRTGDLALPMTPPPVKRYQRPSPFVQSDDPRIITKASEVVGAHTDPWQQTVALNRWVFSTLRKQLTVGLPSAVDILAASVGDCHEHTILFTALARSVKLPTRMVAGLVYWQGRLYYHAWPEVWLDQWIPTDPTLGQLIADATHLGLSEAENETLISLGRFLGKLRVQVLESRLGGGEEAVGREAGEPDG